MCQCICPALFVNQRQVVPRLKAQVASHMRTRPQHQGSLIQASRQAVEVKMVQGTGQVKRGLLPMACQACMAAEEGKRLEYARMTVSHRPAACMLQVRNTDAEIHD
jgi:hypothetical protein